MFVSPEPKIENETVRENQSAFHIKKVARIFSKVVQQHGSFKTFSEADIDDE